MGIKDNINYGVVCKQSWPFSEVEKKLYEDFPEFNNPQTFFMVNERKVEKDKTLKENNIKNNSIISISKVYI